MHELLPPLLVIVGLVFLTASLNEIYKIVVAAPARKLGWHVALLLMIFFTVSYISLLMFMTLEPETRFSFMASVVLMVGGVFVFLIMRLNVDTICQFHKLTKLEDENVRIKIMQQRLKMILDNAAEAIITYTEDGIIESGNPAAYRLFGYVEKELEGLEIWQLLSGKKSEIMAALPRMSGKETELEGVNKKGLKFPVLFRVSEIVLHGQHFYTSLISDITEHKLMLDKVQDLADHDELTGLYNRRYFIYRLEDTVALLNREFFPCALLFIDLDHFKTINDSYGHESGDMLLQAIAEVLRQSLRKSDCICRLGGDEFAVLLFNVSAENSLKVAEKIRTKIGANIFTQLKEEARITCSIGVTVLAGNLSPEEALAHADTACYQAKKQGRNGVVIMRLT